MCRVFWNIRDAADQMERSVTKATSDASFSSLVDDTVDVEMLFEDTTNFWDLGGMKCCYAHANEVVGIIEPTGDKPLAI